MRRVLFLVMILLMIVTACAPTAATQEPATVDEQPTPTPMPEPTHIPVDLTPAQRAALTTLSETLNLPVDQITLISTEEVTWPNGCLGIVRMGVLCTQAEVPGFTMILEANGQNYEVHTNQDGSVALLVEGAQASDDLEQQLIKQLAANLGLEESDISVVSSEDVEFGDACLGVGMEGVMCAQVVTPGRIIVLEANGVQYEYHVSADGSRVQPATLALVWKREGGIAGFCDTLTVFLSGEIYANRCRGQADGKMDTLAHALSTTDHKQFSEWVSELGQVTIDASDPKGVSDQMTITLNFWGTGDKQPTKSEQQAMLSFAQDLYQQLAQ